jgi:dihydrofolate reductase/thymidylate synthase
VSKGFSIVVAMDRKRGIGKDGKLPWKLSGDMKFFKELTTCPDSAAVEKRWGLKPGESGQTHSWDEVKRTLQFAHKLPEADAKNRNAVIMGRKTAAGLPSNYNPLPDRENQILTKILGAHMVNLSSEVEDLREAGTWDIVWNRMKVISAPEVFVIGGGQIFEEVMKYPTCTRLYITEIDAEFPCDTFFPETPGFQPTLSSPWIEESGTRYRFRRYDRVSA